MIAALFVETNGCYYGLPNVDPWDVERDARFYAGPYAVVAHPPCERWGMLAHQVQSMYGLKIGDDAKCFERALSHVETYGGILEHPRGSMAFERYGINTPFHGMWRATRKGFVTQIYQSAYGHRATKATWLYVVGLDSTQLPFLDWSTPRGTHEIGGEHTTQGKRPSLPKKERYRTPVRFRDLLISIAERCRPH